ncbi:MAG TPA: GlcNAc-PI de-N-acetylase, partial [Lapillicoccus sp.]|nr:GlcNAc-PI de-N-acetylase [Lapillicoccus sp.]
EISWEVDVSAYLEQRRAAVRAHASQGDTAWMRSMPDDDFAMMFSSEYYIEPGRSPAMEPGWPFVAPD